MIHERINSKKYFHTDMEWQYFEISLVFTHVKVKGNLTFTNHKICVWECQIKNVLVSSMYGSRDQVHQPDTTVL